MENTVKKSRSLKFYRFQFPMKFLLIESDIQHSFF